MSKRGHAILFLLMVSPLRASVLSDTVAKMAPGSWATLVTNNINPTFADSQGDSGYITPYAEYLKWDPVSHRLFFLGGDHYLSGTPVMRHVQYDENTNTWSTLPQQSWFSAFSSHGYDHGALDPVHRFFYFRPPGDLTLHRWNIDTGTWTNMPQNNVIQFDACCVGIDYFPELKGVVWISDENNNLGGVTRLDDATGQWTRVGQAAAYQMGGYQNIARYNPVYKVFVFGGGNEAGAPNDPLKMWKLDASGNVTALKDAPFVLGTYRSIFTVDPVSGKYLVFNSNSQFWTYDVVADAWALQASGSQVPFWTDYYLDPAGGTAVDPIFEVVAGPVDTYGVNAIVACNGPSGCKIYLYKHATSPSNPCDLNGDGFVNSTDLQSLANAILSNSNNLVYDLNKDNLVNAIDAQFLANVILNVRSCS
jgi:hypothetical protein